MAARAMTASLLLLALAVAVVAGDEASSDETVLLQRAQSGEGWATNAEASSSSKLQKLQSAAHKAKVAYQTTKKVAKVATKVAKSAAKIGARVGMKTAKVATKVGVKAAKVSSIRASHASREAMKAFVRARATVQPINKQLEAGKAAFEAVAGEGMCVDKSGKTSVNQVFMHLGAEKCREACMQDPTCPGYAAQKDGSCTMYTDVEPTLKGSPAVAFAIASASRAPSESTWEGGVCYRKKPTMGYKLSRYGIY